MSDTVFKPADLTARASLCVATWLVGVAGVVVTRHARVADLASRAAGWFISAARRADAVVYGNVIGEGS